MNQLILGDCLEVMRKMDSESIDLIYLDPPFFSNRNYEVIWGDKGEVRSFEDRWSGGIDHYISWLKERVAEMHRLLKPTGSIYLHCDWHADAYIRVYILDKIFGENNFLNHIIWKRTNNPKGSQFKDKKYGIYTDSILYYAKNITGKEIYHFDLDKVRTPLTEEEILLKYPHFDEKGRYLEYPILRSASKGERPNLCYEYKGFKPEKWGWVVNIEKLKEIDQRGDIAWRKNGSPYRKYRDYEDRGKPIGNIWDDLNRIQSNSSESIGYPTQKPEKLLERIIQASSNEGDTILDPFVGGGTSVVVADKLGRNWIGIDQSVQAVKVSELRLNKRQGIFSNPFSVLLHKYDYDTLRDKDAFQFEAWIVEQFGGKSNIKQRGDFGIDGITRNGTPIQVKRSDNIGRNVIDNFKSALERYDKALYEKNKSNGDEVGFIIAFSFGKGAIQEVARLKNEENTIVQLVKVEDIVPIAKKPKLNVVINDLGADGKGIRDIEFIAEGESEAGIEFYSYDFNYNSEENKFNPSVVLDRIGKQTHKFKPGLHTIAVKVVDSEGLEALEIIRIKVNGVVEIETDIIKIIEIAEN
jgi:DNA modification methylase